MGRTTEYTTPLQGIPYYSSVGIIKAADQSGAQYCVGEISYERFDDQNYQYVMTPYWEQITALPIQVFSGIPGFDMTKRCDRYYRVNITPAFIQMRTPSESREDLWELLDEVDLVYYDRFEWLLRSGKRCGDDNLTVVRKREKECYDITKGEIDLNDLQPGDRVILNKLYDVAADDAQFAKCVYRLLVNGAEVYLSDEKCWLGDEQRRGMLYLLSNMMDYSENYMKVRQRQGIRRAKEEGKYHGRTKISVDPLLLRTVVQKFKMNEIREEEALKALNVSRATFYRRMRELNN